MVYTTKQWRDDPDHTTPLSAAGLNDWESRIAAGIASAGTGTGGGGSSVGNPMAYGAVGDGAVDDTYAIQAAVNAQTRGAVILDLTQCPKTYRVSGPIVVPDFSVEVVGKYIRRNETDNSTHLDLTCSPSFAGDAVITTQAAHSLGAASVGVGVTVRGVGIDMGSIPYTSSSGGIRLMGRQMSALDCCIISCPGTGINFTNTNAGGVALPSTSFCTDLRCIGNQVQGFGATGIATAASSNTTDGYIMGNVVTGWTLTYGDQKNNTGPGISIAQCEDMVVEYNHVRHCGRDGMLLDHVTDTRMLHNYVNQFAQEGSASTNYRGFDIDQIWGSGLTMFGNLSRCDESIMTNASTYILYFHLGVNDNTGQDPVVRCRDNMVHQSGSGTSHSIGFRTSGNVDNNRTLKIVGDNNMLIGPNLGNPGNATTTWRDSTGLVSPTWVASVMGGA